MPYALYLWTYASSVLALAAFFGLPAAALWGGLGMGAVALPLAWSLRRRGAAMSRWARALVATGSALAAAGTVHAAVNAVLLRRPDPAAGPDRSGSRCWCRCATRRPGPRTAWPRRWPRTA